MTLQDDIKTLSDELGRRIEKPIGTCEPGTGGFVVRGVIDDLFAKGYDLRDLIAGTPVVKASVSLFDCLCEFEEMEISTETGYCNEYREAWDNAVIAYKKAMGDWPGIADAAGRAPDAKGTDA